MPSVRPLKSIPAVVIAVSLTTGFSLSSAFAASDSSRRPVILDSQGGIIDGQSGTVVQTGPLSRQPIVGAQPIARPAELAPDSSMPIIVAPYIQLPAGGGTSPQPRPPRPMPRSQ